MKQICIITGGGSGMGFETAKLVGKTHTVFLCGRTVEKLHNAVDGLKELGIDAEAYACDVSDRKTVEKLADYAEGKGKIKTVINAAGIASGTVKNIFAVNALGTVNVNEVFLERIQDYGCILNIASVSGYMMDENGTPYDIFRLALTDKEAFATEWLKWMAAVPVAYAAGTTYALAKKFVQWYTRRAAVKGGARNIRVVSISPGTFVTPMVTNSTEADRKQSEEFGKRNALKRLGDPVEIARMITFMVSDECSYLTGTDVLYDGGIVACLEQEK
ncbi:SDR family oxidoreductase [Lachnospiraceae bacterium 29-91]